MPDIESLAIVHAAAWEAAYRGLFPDRVIDEITIEKRSRNWERSIADPDRENLLYEENGEVLGFLSYGPSREEKLGVVGEVIACYVLPNAWRRGVGRARTTLQVAGPSVDPGGFAFYRVVAVDEAGSGQRLIPISHHDSTRSSSGCSVTTTPHVPSTNPSGSHT